MEIVGGDGTGLRSRDRRIPFQRAMAIATRWFRVVVLVELDIRAERRNTIERTGLANTNSGRLQQGHAGQEHQDSCKNLHSSLRFIFNPLHTLSRHSIHVNSKPTRLPPESTLHEKDAGISSGIGAARRIEEIAAEELRIADE